MTHQFFTVDALRHMDARLALLLVAVFSSCIWALPALGLAVYSLAALVLWLASACFARCPQGVVRRSWLFCLFWPLLAFCADAIPIIWGALHTHTSSNVWAHSLATYPQLLAPGQKAFFLFWRLALLMAFALWLTTTVSARALALAATWFLRPLLGEKAWKPALALALMTSFLPLAHQTLAQTRQAARIRRLPDSGFAYWKNALPHMFRYLQNKSLAQATAVVCRQLDGPHAWTEPMHVKPAQVSCFCLALGCALLPFFLY